MEKQTKADNEVETLNSRWDSVKKVIDERVTKVSKWLAVRVVGEGDEWCAVERGGWTVEKGEGMSGKQ